MTTRSRFAKAFVPRFGLLWMATAMLLVVSGAGWWKFHRDLYVEERAVVEALKSTGRKVAFHHRDPGGFVGSREDEPTDVPWNAPLLEPIRMIVVQGAPSPEARDAALRLPRLVAYRQATDPYFTAQDRWPGIEEFLGRELPTLPERSLDLARLDEPLPEGEELPESRQKVLAEAIQAAWQNAAAVPPRRLVVSETRLAEGPPTLRVDVLEPGRGFRYSKSGDPTSRPGAALLLDGDVSWFELARGSVWRSAARRFRSDEPLESTLHRRFPNDDFPYVAADFRGDGIVGRWMAGVAPRFEIQRVAQVDDVRYRVDFAPFEVPYDPVRDVGSQGEPRIDEWNLVVRSDLDWAPEESRIVQQKFPQSPELFVRRMSQRFVRVGDYAVLSERAAVDSSIGPSPRLSRPPETSYSRYVAELDPKFDARVFDPRALDPEPWPEPRELPWLRWYRVTFAVGCGLALFLVGRRVANWRRVKKEASAAKSKAVAEEPLPANEPV